MPEHLLERGVEEVIDKEHLFRTLERGKKLRIKYGVDPTAPDIHLGHAVILRKLKEFQLRGHKVILVIGDYTTRIGDPSGRNKTRPMLDEKEIEKNAKTYLKQVGKILSSKNLEVQRNSRWFKKISLNDWLKLLAKFTLAQITERDDFAKRIKEGTDIGLHELMYSVMQAYDSVMIKADIEIGGTDQKFNMLAARDLQRKMEIAPQDVITMPLLIGIDGQEKMSKSLGNAIGIAEAPDEIFGKVMSIPDELIIPYFRFATDISDGGLTMVEKELAEGANPRDVKARLAFLIVEMYYDSEKAEEASIEFGRVFKDKQLPTKIPEKVVHKSAGNITEIIYNIGLASSKSEARRLINQNCVKVDQKIINDENAKIVLEEDMVIQVGKRKYLRIKKGRGKKRG